MNSIQSQKYRYPSEAIKENAVKIEKFRHIYDFYRPLKKQKYVKRYARADAKKDKSLGRRLRELLKISERVLALAEFKKKKKKDAPKHLYK